MDRKFKTTLNLREVHKSAYEAPAKEHLVSLYRSARLDFLLEEEVDKLKNLGIKCILDLRTAQERRESKGGKLLDNIYDTVEVTVDDSPFSGRKVAIKSLGAEEFENEMKLSRNSANHKHYLLSLVSAGYARRAFQVVAFHIKLLFILCYLVDYFFKTGRFFKAVTKYYMATYGLYDLYRDFVVYCTKEVCAAMKILSQPGNCPALICCTLGKDRTGVITALTLSCLGFDRDYIIDDYAKSEKNLEPDMPNLMKELSKLGAVKKSYLWSRRETMASLLTFIDQTYGSVGDYLCSIGFGKEDQDRLKRIYCGQGKLR